MRPHLGAMEIVVEAVGQQVKGKVAVVGGPDVDPWAAILTQRWPDLQVTRVHVSDDASDAHVRLTVEGPFDAVIDASDERANDQALLFERTYMHLRKGGAFVARRLVPIEAPATRLQGEAGPDAPAPEAQPVPQAHLELPNENPTSGPPYAGDLWELLSVAQEARTRDYRELDPLKERYRDAEGVGRTLDELHVHSKVLRVVNGMRMAPILREEEVAPVLEARPELGTTLETQPSSSWDATCSYASNRPADPYVRRHFDVPSLAIRRYDGAICSRGQVVTKDDIIFPDTFRQNWMERLSNIYVVEGGPRFGRVRRDLSEAYPLDGAWFHLDCEWPGQFGHLMTEQLSRLWAWDRVKALEPDLKVLITVEPEREPAVLASFEIDILSTFGIESDDVHVFTSPCRPQRLYTSTPMFALSRYVHEDMDQVWTRVGDHVVSGAEPGERPRRLFLSRPPHLKRSCHNVAEVETFFAGQGFTVVHPETHALAEQVAMFREAEVIAGFAGSGLFSLAFCTTPKRVIALGPDAYTARNEFLISAVRGHDLTSVWSRSDVEHPEGSWTFDAFASSFTFDFDDEGRYLEQVLARLDG